MAQKRNLPPAPVLFPGDEPFWEAMRSGQLLAKHCQDCDTLHYYPRSHCPFCGSEKTEWHSLSGRGTIYSYSIVERSPKPLAPAIIELEEGLLINSVVTDADVRRLNIGDEVILHSMPTQDGPPVPAFTTVRANAAREYTKAAYTALECRISDQPRLFERGAVIGSGNMGIGIATALLNAGLSVRLIDQSDDSLENAVTRITESLNRDVERGRLTENERDARLSVLTADRDLSAIASADVVIEAVFEDMEVKQKLFAEIDQYASPSALLATNTSTLDIDRIAAATTRPQSVIGLHFFTPANVMKLVEVVHTDTTSADTLDAALQFSAQIKKTAVPVGVCDGFVGNRLMIARERQASRLLLEGALPEQVDRVLREVGLPMGTFELQDMTGGIELMYRSRQRRGQKDWLLDELYNRGRTGLRAGRGFYRYEPGKKRPLIDPEVTTLIEEASCVEGIERRAISDQEVHDRLILPMINEGAKLLEEGIVDRASDIDLIWQLGYGWPDWKGGPMYYADQIGLPELVRRLTARERHGDVFKPADLLVELAGADAARISDIKISD
ncbi:3-hydroxyacyl-CoA dehydrogenase/uncharacterized OB-fold protein [Paraburkholderia youngii]|uniref:3-hydroxyacyl-CoA dehydrogenase NAD-binding domain-containing protein n=1 Tax=Paraburkholderia youngii TaxID=2782701 RepID=UPI003D1C077E